MTLEATQAASTTSEDFGLAGHLASIDRLHRDALAQLDALAKPWGDLWSSQLGAAAARTEEQPVIGGHHYGAHAAAA